MRRFLLLFSITAQLFFVAGGVVPSVYAQELSQMSAALTSLRIGMAADYTIQFTVPSAVLAGIIRVDLRNAVSATNNVDYTDIDLLYGTAGSEVSHPIYATPGSNLWGAQFDAGTKVLTFAYPTSNAAPILSGDQVVIRIGSNATNREVGDTHVLRQLTNSRDPGSPTISLQAGQNTGKIAIALLENDSIGVSSTATPLPPTNLQATTITVSAITLTWKDNAENEEGFLIERKFPHDVFYNIIGHPFANETSFVDTTVQPETSYMYRVRAFSGDVQSDPSNIVSVFTPASSEAASATTQSAIQQQAAEVQPPPVPQPPPPVVVSQPLSTSTPQSKESIVPKPAQPMVATSSVPAPINVVPEKKEPPVVSEKPLSFLEKILQIFNISFPPAATSTSPVPGVSTPLPQEPAALSPTSPVVVTLAAPVSQAIEINNGGAVGIVNVDNVGKLFAVVAEVAAQTVDKMNITPVTLSQAQKLDEDLTQYGGGGELADGLVYQIEAFKNNEIIHSLDQCTLLTFKYSSSLIEGIDENTLKISSWNPIERRWVPEASSTVDTTQKIVSARVCHFTLFSLLGKVARSSFQRRRVISHAFVQSQPAKLAVVTQGVSRAAITVDDLQLKKTQGTSGISSVENDFYMMPRTQFTMCIKKENFSKPVQVLLATLGKNQFPLTYNALKNCFAATLQAPPQEGNWPLTVKAFYANDRVNTFHYSIIVTGKVKEVIEPITRFIRETVQSSPEGLAAVWFFVILLAFSCWVILWHIMDDGRPSKNMPRKLLGKL